MRKSIFTALFIFFTMNMNAQSFDYQSKWKELETLSEQGGVKSLLPKIDAIFQQAKRDKNTTEIVNSLIFKEQILAQTQEFLNNNTWEMAIVDFETIIADLDGGGAINRTTADNGVTIAILQSLLAKIYENYANSTSWKRRSITETENPPTDISEWTTARRLRKSFDLYNISLKNAEILQKNETENYRKILKTADYITFFPTLYDVLAYRYFLFLNSNKNNARLILSTDSVDFEKLKDKTIRSLISFHKTDIDKSAFLNFHLIAFDVYSDWNEHLNALTSIADRFKSEPFSAHLLYKAADILKNNGEKKRAYEICKNVVQTWNTAFPQNKWTENAKSLMLQIEQQSFNAEIDRILLPNTPVPLYVSTTNIDSVFYRITKYTEEIVDVENSKTGKISKQIDDKNQKIVRTGILTLRHFDDFSEHSTIVKIDALPAGKYDVEIANNADFKKNENGKNPELAVTSLEFEVHNWFLIEISKGEFQLTNRKTGKPIANKKLQIWNDDNEKYFTANTNKHGIFSLPKNDDDELYIYNPETEAFIEIGRNHYYEREKQENLKIDFFTDRAIYRPSQTVYFKGIVYKQKGNESEIIRNKKITVQLQNTNYQKVSELELVTNDYGSVFGEFILPQNGLTGNYHIVANDYNGRCYFKVEEYKRPKFEVSLDSLKGVYTLENEVKITGKAESYAGAVISDAKVVYSVERREIFPYRAYWQQPHYANPETITQGETTTEGEGKFSINFIAKPKNEKKNGEIRTYTYTITANATDINGETRTANISVSIGDLPLKLELNVPEKSLQKNFTKIGIQSTNLNDVKENAVGKIILTKLIAPERILLPNIEASLKPVLTGYTENSYQLYDYQQFIKYFPHLPYNKNEIEPKNYEKGASQEFDFDTEKSDFVDLNAVEAHLRGFYLIQAISLFGNDTIKTEKIIQILDDKTLKAADNTFFAARQNKSSYQIGDEIKISFLSDIQNAVAVVHLGCGGKWFEHKELPIKNGIAGLTLTASQEHAKNDLMVVAYLFFENGYKYFSLPIAVQDKSKTLNISTKTFRDKLTPNAPETWELHISGEDKDKFTAEVLATMYDASLDEFSENSFRFNPFAINNNYYLLLENFNHRSYRNFYEYGKFNTAKSFNYVHPIFPNLKDFYGYYYGSEVTGSISEKNYSGSVQTVYSAGAEVASDIMIRGVGSTNVAEPLYLVDGVLQEAGFNMKDVAKLEKSVQIRKNLQETAFFYPNLYTDQNGDVVIKFTSPEALTKWKLLALAHTQDLHSGTAEFYAQTQKELMVVPNLPRFLREGDEVVISAKINNLSKENLNGSVKFELFNGLTGEPLKISLKEQKFLAEINKNAEVSWKFTVPKIQVLEYKIIAIAGEFSDGEQSVLPVLPNRMLITETMPIFAKEGQTKTFKFDKLAENQSNTLQNFKLTLEITTNPLWLAVMSLPYLREYPYDCSEQIFSRLYGNILSTHILNQNPKIKRVFDNWNAAAAVGTKNFSPLQDNEQLKNILLEETPFLHDAQNENEQRKRLALLFDLNKMSQENADATEKLVKRQNADGGFAWFEGGQSSVYITEHVVQGFGQLERMLNYSHDEYFNQNTANFSQNINNLIQKSIKFIDSETIKRIKLREKNIQKNGGKLDGKEFIHYYYVRSFWKDKYPLPQEATKYLADINKDITEYFKNYDLQRKAMIATTLNRYGYANSAKLIINNLKETSVETDKMGMYWKDNRAGWLWYQSPVEAQTKAIEAFAEILPEKIANIEEMKIWLIKNRQTNAWNSTKATTDAVYALMNFGKDWTNAEEGVNVSVGNTPIVEAGLALDLQTEQPQELPLQTAAGYIKTSWSAAEITPEMGIVTIEKTSAGTMWGGMYWQYFENLDKITSANSNVKMQKQIFVKKNTDNGQILTEITNEKPINVGDWVTIKLTIKIDRDMQYIHIKDMRAAGLEPINVLSSYKYQNGCAYYESTRDAATNFFFERMTAGVYVFEYDVRANNAGVFSNGITTLQNMYAPEMSCHSEGVKIEIK